jgi:hypothetical protein
MPIATCETCGYQLSGTLSGRNKTQWHFDSDYIRTCALIREEPEDSPDRKKAMSHECPRLWEAMAEASSR